MMLTFGCALQPAIPPCRSAACVRRRIRRPLVPCAGYALLASPNQTPYRDMYFLEKLVGLGAADGFQLNIVFTQLFFIMGIWPAIYAALLIPSARSGNKARTSDRALHPVHLIPKMQGLQSSQVVCTSSRP